MSVIGQNPTISSCLASRDTHQLLVAELLIVGAVKGKGNFDREGLARAADAVRDFRHRYLFPIVSAVKAETKARRAARLPVLSVPESWAGACVAAEQLRGSTLE